MLSISKLMDEYDIAQEVRLERQVHKGSFLLLEGATDVKRFSEFLDEKSCSIANCYGRGKASKAIHLLNEDGFLGAVAVLDCDFDRILKKITSVENVIYSEVHDYDLEWLSNDVLRKYLVQVGDPQKCEALGDHEKILLHIIELIKPISVLKLMNANGNICYRLSILKMEDFFDGHVFDIQAMVEGVFEGRNVDDKVKSDLVEKVRFLLPKKFPLLQITNGHDAMTALGIALRDKLASRAKAQTWGSEVELHIRLAFTDKEFIDSSVYNNLAEWEAENKPYRVLHLRFAKV